jgi:hypothetical protein
MDNKTFINQALILNVIELSELVHSGVYMCQELIKVTDFFEITMAIFTATIKTSETLPWYKSFKPPLRRDTKSSAMKIKLNFPFNSKCCYDARTTLAESISTFDLESTSEKKNNINTAYVPPLN